MSEAGTRIAGRYEVQRELARGGMGRVLLVRDVELDRPLALKTLLDAPDEVSRLRLAEEAQLSGQLSHPNIVPVHELGWHAGAPYVAMKFVEGRDLKALVRELREKKTDVAAAYGLRRRLRIFLTVCEAIAYAHEQGVIHRDLKPANVMLGPGDEVLVLDWGLAKSLDKAGAAPRPGLRASGESQRSSLDSGTRSAARRVSSRARQQSGDLTGEGEILGTPAYMPPEQADSAASLDRRADVYSLGAILYEVLVLEAPYSGSSLAVLKALIDGPPRPPRARVPDTPPALDAIVQKAMAREKADRYPDAAALALDVEAFLDDRAVSAWHEGPAQALVRLVTRHRLASAVVAASLVVLAGAGALVRSIVGREDAAAALEADGARASEAEARAAGERADAARARAGAELAGVQATNEAARAAVDFDATARTAVALEKLGAERSRALAETDRRRSELEALGRRPGLPSEDAAEVARATAPLLVRVAAARRSIDRAFARAHLGRDPAAFLRALDSGGVTLDLGPEEALARARALLRTGRGAEAGALLEGRTVAAGPLALEARVLALAVGEAPLAELRAAVEQAIAADATEAWLHLARAECLVRDGEFDAAGGEYDRARLLDPVDTWVVGSRVRRLEPIYVKEEMFANDLGDFERLVESEDHDLHVAASLIFLFHNGDRPRFEREIADEVGRGLSLLEAGRALAEGALVARDPTRAEAAARKVLERAPEDRVALGLLAEARLALGDQADAARVAERGLARHPGDGRLSFVAGEVLRLKGAFPAAVPFLERAARTSRLSDRWERLARCLSCLDTPEAWERGIEAGRRALSYDPWATFSYHSNTDPVPGDPRLSRTLGDLRAKQGRFAAAALHYARALDFMLFFPRIQLGAGGLDLGCALLAGEAHERLGLTAEAVDFYRIAARDPRLADEAAKRIARLSSGR